MPMTASLSPICWALAVVGVTVFAPEQESDVTSIQMKGKTAKPPQVEAHAASTEVSEVTTFSTAASRT